MTEMVQWSPEIHTLFPWHGIVARRTAQPGITVLSASCSHYMQVTSTCKWSMRITTWANEGLCLLHSSFCTCQLNGGDTDNLEKS